MKFLDVPKRTKKNRTFGITSVTDFGISVGELENILMDYHKIIDIVKLGIGSAYVTPNLEEKIQLYKKYGIKPYFGGTLFEKCYSQGKIKEYINYLQKLGVEWIEVSNGTLDIPISERLRLVNELKYDFNVIGEVGSKDSDKEMPLSQWYEEITSLIEAGCKYVITEGRDSGTSGIYHSNGQIKTELILDLLKRVDFKKIIFEAASSKHQMFFINQVGPNVNLGNVRIRDCLLLESQRCGLRSETFFMKEEKVNH